MKSRFQGTSGVEVVLLLARHVLRLKCRGPIRECLLRSVQVGECSGSRRAPDAVDLYSPEVSVIFRGGGALGWTGDVLE